MEVTLKSDLGAVVVVYNFEEDVPAIITQLVSQGMYTVVVDNSDYENQDLKKLANEYLFQHGNIGIAAAQNKGITALLESGKKGVFTFDQDSIIPADYMTGMLDAINSDIRNVGIISPAVFDTNTKSYSNPNSYIRQGETITIVDKHQYVVSGVYSAARPIASGQFVFSEVFRKIGLMNEEYFIDAVDTEFNLRAILAGFESVVFENVVLKHEIGDKKSIHFLFVSITPSNHSAFRKYYITRNNIWMLKTFKQRVKGLGRHVLLTVLSQLVYTAFENQKVKKISRAFNGIVDGIFGGRKI